MKNRLAIAYAFLSLALNGCWLGTGDLLLDSAIPRVETKPEEIAVVRTQWVKGFLRQTTFLDRQNRVLEDFFFGRTNQKILNRYIRDKRVYRVEYYHSDSHPPSYIGLTENWYSYDEKGRVSQVSYKISTRDGYSESGVTISGVVGYHYKAPNDTIKFSISQQPHQSDVSAIANAQLDTSSVINSNHFYRNRQGQIIRQVKIEAVKKPRPDTSTFFSRRFAYDKKGRRTLAWFDMMYLGLFYTPYGPDTIHYEYDVHGRLTREIHRYTIDRRNKREISLDALSDHDRETAIWYRGKFFQGDSIFSNNNKTDTIIYRYEKFVPEKHLPLQVSKNVGY